MPSTRHGSIFLQNVGGKSWNFDIFSDKNVNFKNAKSFHFSAEYWAPAPGPASDPALGQELLSHLLQVILYPVYLSNFFLIFFRLFDDNEDGILEQSVWFGKLKYWYQVRIPDPLISDSVWNLEWFGQTWLQEIEHLSLKFKMSFHLCVLLSTRKWFLNFTKI